MKKIGILLVAIFLTLVIVSAQNVTEQAIGEKAYSCLEEKLGDNCGNSNSVEQIAFSILAIADNCGTQSDCKSALLNKQKTNNCWGNIKETSLAIIALDYIGQNTEDEKECLLDNKKTAGLEWYLEIDSASQTACSLTGGGSININENKKISGSVGSCFSLAYDGYWLEIKNSCLDRNLTVSCDKDFMSTLLYKKSGSNVWHVSSDVKSASAGGKTEHSVKSYCFGTSGCDYESSLWATLALSRTEESVSEFLPYLVAFAEDNGKYFPSAFLHILKSEEEYLSDILLEQETQGYWKLDNNEYYDTALALLAISESEAESLAEQWLEENQGTKGCWHSDNIRDTAFILWAIYPRTPCSANGGAENYCQDYDYYCVSQGQCNEVNGSVLGNFYCPGLKICCDKPALEEEVEEPEEEAPEEEYVPLPEEGASHWWIWLLAILIILAILGIIFRNNLRVLIWKFKNKFKKGPVITTRPRFPPAAASGLRRMPGRPVARRPVTGVKSVVERELDETLRKLREMSK